VRERASRLVGLFERPATDALAQAARLGQEGAGYLLGAPDGAMASPVLPLRFLEPDVQPRFRFSRATRTPEFPSRVVVLAFQEVRRPTVVHTVAGSDWPASGRFWIDGNTGEVLQSELVLSGDGVEARFTTLFRSDARLGLAAPVRMHEESATPGRRIVGVATYEGFRRFDERPEGNPPAPRPGP
jgi:hypothetical protein